MEVVPYTLIPGIREDIDRSMLPPGSLVAATSVRSRKGGIGKANGLVENTGTSASTGPAFSGPVDALGFAAGRQVAVMNGTTWARPSSAGEWQPVGRASRARPVKAHWSAFTETDGAAGVIHSSCAVAGSFIATAHSTGSGVQLAIVDSSGIRKVNVFYTARYRPRIFAVGTTFVLVYGDSGTGDIYYRTINGTTLAVSAESASIGLNWSVLDVFDAAPISSTHWLLAFRLGSTTLKVAYRSLSAEVNVQSVVIANNDVTACCVYGTDGENAFVTYSQTAANVQRIAAFAADLTSTTLAPTTLTTSAGATAAVMTRRDSTSVWVVYEVAVTAPTHYEMTVFAYHESTGIVGGTGAVAWHVRAASRPWSGSSTSLQMWVHTDSGAAQETESKGAWATQRRYSLVTLAMNSATPPDFGMFIETELSPDERAFEQMSFHPPEVAFRSATEDGGGGVVRGYFPALSVIRTQSTTIEAGTAALVLYEWDTEAGFEARARRVGEVGGQGVVFGGGLQEIPSARIGVFTTDTFARGVENGFLFAPAILSAAKTATGADGLTADAVYQFVAVFEYITADGLRVRSAPSKIVSETPSAGLLNVELKITTAPTTEREFSSPPNATAVHIYATVGGGSTFHRITGDAGLSPGRGSSSTGLITYVHSVADTVYRTNEPVYTDIPGVVPNNPAPAHRFGWVGGGYAWLGGLFNPQLIERSKLSTPNEPVTFTRHNTHRCLLPEEATAGAWLDNVSVVFSRTGIYLVPPTLGAPQRLPSTVGCLDWRSVVELPDGIGFQSRRGYELLPRGFGQPQILSDAVQDQLRGRRVISATVTGHGGSSFSQAHHAPGRHLVLVAIDTALSSDRGVRLVLDLDSGRWVSSDPAMSDSGFIGEVVTTWDGRLIVAPRSGADFYLEDPTNWDPETPMSITLADLSPFGVVNRGLIARAILRGEIRSSTRVTLTAYKDGEYSKPLLFNNQEQTVHGTAGDKFFLEWNMPLRQVSSLTLKFDFADPTATAVEGVVVHACGLEVSGLPGRPRTPQERTAA